MRRAEGPIPVIDDVDVVLPDPDLAPAMSPRSPATGTCRGIPSAGPAPEMIDPLCAS